jgi:hypothetical protein
MTRENGLVNKNFGHPWYKKSRFSGFLPTIPNIITIPHDVAAAFKGRLTQKRISETADLLATIIKGFSYLSCPSLGACYNVGGSKRVETQVIINNFLL